MKIKNHHTSRSGSPAHYTSSTSHLGNEESTSNDQTSSNTRMMTPSSQQTQILTRSAVRAAQQQQQKLNDTPLCHKHHKHHGTAQHAIGKIVKPIPVRPMSSSSSSSSTHSSQFSSNFLTKSIHSNLSTLGARLAESMPIKSDGQNFSLIAKYFASFPATRLAKTSQIFSQPAPAATEKSTPFLPFRKNSSTNSINSNNNNNASEQVHSTFVLRSQSSHSTNTTDHLCTNFRRMIKLNDPESPLFNNIRNSSPGTNAANNFEQTCNNNQHFNSINYNSAQNASSQNDTVENQLNQFQLPLNNQDTVNACFMNNTYDIDHHPNDEDTTSRLGQITMETRSTRKFLIKHHPYLQHNQASKILNQRPSINFMKKLSSKSNQGDETTLHSDYSNNRSGRSSRSNNSGLNETNTDQNLLKFTDTAPTESKQSSIKRRQSVKPLTTASALSADTNQHNQKKQHTTRSRTNKNFNRHPSETNNDSGQGDYCSYCDYFADDGDLNGHSCDEYHDEQEEDSSGYYSSYHSVDLISSSGGSCVGVNQIVKQPNEASLNLEQTSKSSNNNSLVPQHSYHTRYLTHCLEQKQEMEHQQVESQNTPSGGKNQAVLFTNTSIPTTRLRFQQQLAAQATGKFACDLDLDQIEND